jgi:hypothetical protein
MLFVLGTNKRIHCPNCHFEGIPKGKRKSAIFPGMVFLSIGLLCIFSGFPFLLLPMLFAALVYLIYSLFKMLKPICPQCKNENLVPLKTWLSQNPQISAKHAQLDSNNIEARIRDRKCHWGIIFFCLIIALLLYPFPNKSFLFRNAEVLNGRVSKIKGASVVFFLDPSFYYKFKISYLNFQYVVSDLGLKEKRIVSQRDYDIKLMKRGPLFWNFWWWRPRAVPEAVLYTGYREGNRFYFLYNLSSQVAYLYIQNT